jgi:hypothetical protein
MTFASLTSPSTYIYCFVSRSLYTWKKCSISFIKCRFISDRSFNEFQIGSETGLKLLSHLVLIVCHVKNSNRLLPPLHNQEKLALSIKLKHLTDHHLKQVFLDKSIISWIHQEE